MGVNCGDVGRTVVEIAESRYMKVDEEKLDEMCQQNVIDLCRRLRKRIRRQRRAVLNEARD